MKKKSLVLALALVLALTFVIGGTIAWLTANTNEVENVFTTSDIGVGLEEGTTNYQMIPGHTIAKDPKAWVTAGSVDCFLFVKIEESANFDEYMTYGIANGWTKLDGVDGVYYMKIVGDDAKNTMYPILLDNKVNVLGTVTKADMEEAKTNQPTLTFTAYASQLYSTNGVEFEPLQAWNNAQPASATPEAE